MSVNHKAWSRSSHTGPSPSSARKSHSGRGLVMLSPPGVDEMLMAGHQPGVVGREEQRKGRDVLRSETTAQALRVDDLGLALWRVPFELARRPHIARDDAADADIVAAKLSCERPRKPLDRRLGRLVKREP